MKWLVSELINYPAVRWLITPNGINGKKVWSQSSRDINLRSISIWFRNGNENKTNENRTQVCIRMFCSVFVAMSTRMTTTTMTKTMNIPNDYNKHVMFSEWFEKICLTTNFSCSSSSSSLSFCFVLSDSVLWTTEQKKNNHSNVFKRFGFCFDNKIDGKCSWEIGKREKKIYFRNDFLFFFDSRKAYWTRVINHVKLFVWKQVEDSWIVVQLPNEWQWKRTETKLR